MTAPALRALLGGAVDYAGLFPPAGETLDTAVGRYLGYLRGKAAWLLGSFVCPAARLGELSAELRKRGAEAIRVTALGRGGAGPGAFLSGLKADLAEVAACRDRHAGVVQFPALEVKLPAEVLPFDHHLRDLLAAVAEATVTHRMALFFEAPADDADLLDRLLTALQETPFASPVGYKIRCGGLEASAFPPPSRVALALALCLRAGVPVKATAGLHHPLPYRDDALGVKTLGFVNLFAAAVLGKVRRLPASVLQAILEEDDPGAFLFGEALSWRGESATASEVEKARPATLVSFGSCSFTEPVDDLRALGWLDSGERP